MAVNQTDPQHEAMSSVDRAWLRMERPTNLMMICGAMIFGARLELARVKDVVARRFLAFHRFPQRVMETADSAWWETDPDFDLDWHVCRIGLPNPGDKGALEELVGVLASTALDYSKPRWQFHLVDNFQGGSALILRIHHCYADGLALIRVLLAMTETDRRHPHAPAEDEEGEEGSGRSAWERLLGPVTEAAGDAVRLSASAWKLGSDSIEHPAHALDYLQKGVNLAEEAARIALMAPDSHTRFKGKLGVTKRVAWPDPLPLDEVKAVAAVLRCSVNDVLMSTVTGALRGYLAEEGDTVDGVEVRALVPVNLRPPGAVHELGNQFGLIFLSLPVGIEDPLERLGEVKKRMGELKASQQPVVALAILTAMGIAPKGLQEGVLEILAANASAVITNVPGPSGPLYFAGTEIKQQNFWVPQSGGIAMGASIFTYAGHVQFGVIADARRVPRPQAVTERLAGEFEDLLLATLMQPWSEDERVLGN